MTRESLDASHGRQGGRVVPWKRSATRREVPLCEVCNRPMLVGQRRRHGVCSPPLDCCGSPVDLVGDPAKHIRDCVEVRRSAK